MTRWAMILLLSTLAAASGCVELYNARRVDRQHEAGSVHFAVLSVAPWDEFADALQPNFRLTEEEALTMVVPSTRMLEESLMSVMQASVGTADAKSLMTERRTTEERVGSGGGSRTVDTTERDLSPSEIRPKAAVDLSNVSSGQPRVSVLDRPTGIDPMMQYWAATALFQEVQLLNQYIEAAAVRTGFIPYVVRLQVSLMPSARNEPYDAYCTLSFFSTQPEAERVDGMDPEPGSTVTMLRGGSIDELPMAARKGTPQVVPLMSTDNLEATMHSRTIENLQQFATAISAVTGGAAGTADGQAFRREQQGVVGRDLNSLLTVARVSDNSVRVRLGASQSATSNYAMVPRNHSITVLLMLPEGVGQTVQVVAKTVMVDAETGEELAERTSREVRAKLHRVATRYELPRNSAATLRDLLALAQRNDQKAFFAALPEVLPAGFGHGKSLWLDLVSLMVGSQYAATEFEVPHPSTDELDGGDLPTQTALLLDDGGSESILVLQGTGLRAVAKEITAVLRATDESRDLPFVPASIEAKDRGRRLQFRFPSLAAWGVTGDNVELALEVTWDGELLTFPVVQQVQKP
ncbi:MAG: hypothetical protein AAF581_04740 [Planctomycetota bacterium]